MNQLIELIPLVAFFVAYKLYDIYVATGVFLVVMALSLVLQKLLRKPISKAQWITLALGLVFGGMTLAFHDAMFIKVKPTILYWLFAIVLWVSAKWFGKNLIETMLKEHAQAPANIWTKSNRAWILFFAVLGVFNLWLALTFDEQTWVYFKTFGAIALTLLMTVWQIFTISKFMRDKTQPSAVNQSSVEELKND